MFDKLFVKLNCSNLNLKYHCLLFITVVQLDEHFSRLMKEFVSLCLKKVPAEASLLYPSYTLLLFYTWFVC